MKSKSIYPIVCIMALLFSSCARLATLSVEKRHYRNGYHIDFAHNNKSKAAEIKANSQTGRISRVIASNSIPSREPVLISKKIATRVQDAPVNIKNVPENEKGRAAQITLPLTRSHAKTNLHLLSKKEFHSEKAGHEDGLSMFWSVIVLIVVIWLIAYLTGGWGLGGLINLLLLVALVLLVLWLLKVI